MPLSLTLTSSSFSVSLDSPTLAYSSSHTSSSSSRISPPSLFHRGNSEVRTRWVYLAKHKGNIPPETRVQVKWSDARVVLTLEGGECYVRGWGGFSRVGRLGSGARSWALRAFPLVLLSCPWKVINVNCDQGCKGKSIPKNSKRLKGGSSTRGYIIITKVEIWH